MEASALILNMVLSAFGCWMCACRLEMMDEEHTKTVVRLQYVTIATVLAASAISWTYDKSGPTLAQILLAAGIVVFLLLGWGAWRHGLPEYAKC